jgi:hypothetical protein
MKINKPVGFSVYRLIFLIFIFFKKVNQADRFLVNQNTCPNGFGGHWCLRGALRSGATAYGSGTTPFINRLLSARRGLLHLRYGRILRLFLEKEYLDYYHMNHDDDMVPLGGW